MPVPDHQMRTNDFVFSASVDPAWLLVEEGVDPAREREIESLFAVGNGYLGVRASIPEGSSFSHPSTFVAGIYVADGGIGPRLAALPHWLRMPRRFNAAFIRLTIRVCSPTRLSRSRLGRLASSSSIVGIATILQ